jgi:hypothetical protein
LAFPKRAPARIASELFDCIDKKNGRASKWDLIKIVGNESQFHHWVEDFLFREKFIEGQIESHHYFYSNNENRRASASIVEKWQNNAGFSESERKKTQILKCTLFQILALVKARQKKWILSAAALHQV